MRTFNSPSQTTRSNQSGDNKDLINWPDLSVTKLPEGQQFIARFAPSHPKRNPEGIQPVFGFKITNPDGSMFRIISPKSLDDNANCMCHAIIAEVDRVARDNEEFRDWFRNIDVEARGATPDERDAIRFKKHYLEFVKGWVSYHAPALLYAKAREVKNASGYTNLTDWTPNGPRERGFIPVVLEFNNNKATRGILECFQPVDYSIYDREDPLAPVQWNDPVNGQFIGISHQGQGTSKTYTYAPRGKAAFDADLLAKIEENELNYPNIVEWKVKKKLKTDAEILNMVLASTLGPTFLRYGIFEENN